MDSAIDQAIAHHQAGRFVEASQICRRILTKTPNDPDALYVMGLLARRSGNLQLSLKLLRQAVQLSPGNLDALLQLGIVLTELNELLEAEVTYGRFIARLPFSAIAWMNLGNVLRLAGKMDEALSAYERAIELHPNFAAAFSNLGTLLKDLGQIAPALDALRRAVQLDPASPQIHSNLVYATCFSPEYDAAQLLECAMQWARKHEAPLLASHRPHGNDQDPNRRLKIGYVSGDFRNHVIGRNVLPILENHCHEQFEIHCFSLSSQQDILTPRFVAAADHWHPCTGMDDDVLAEKIRGQRIDILVDLTLHMSGNRLMVFARKPAPIQVTWAGYPGTTGLSSIDYRITDPYLDPPGETDAFYSEKSIRLPHSFWCYRPMEGVPEVNPSPALDNKFVTFGCLNNFAKVTDETLSLWSQLLAAIPNSRLLLLCPSAQRRRQIFNDVDPSRIDFVDLTLPDRHMIRYHQIDVALDPLPYTGHTTTLDALWMGVPVVTLSGNTCMARGSVTALTHLNLEHLIAHTAEEYVRIATQLAGDTQGLSSLRQQLRQRMVSSPLCDERGFTQAFENVLHEMWQSNGVAPKPAN